jgi:hypothetical protein
VKAVREIGWAERVEKKNKGASTNLQKNESEINEEI